MRDIREAIDRWLENDVPVAVATVIQTWGSAPRGVGSKMAMSTEGNISGSVSGGCVEGAVFEAGTDVLLTRKPKLLHFGVADETAWDVGLACGGTIDVFVEPLDRPTYNFISGLLEQDEPFAIVTVIAGSDYLLGRKLVVQRGGRLFGDIVPELEGMMGALARATLSEGKSQRRTLNLPDTDQEPFDVFVEIIQPTPTLVIIGGVHIAIALSAVARVLGYRTVVIDPRRAFGNSERFPDIERLIQAWPEEAFSQLELTSQTAVASLTHDPKIDDPALKYVLASPAFYIGALGSRNTHATRKKRLLKAGVDPERLERIHGPIGLDIGAQTPEEIAVAIMAEIIAASRKN